MVDTLSTKNCSNFVYFLAFITFATKSTAEFRIINNHWLEIPKKYINVFIDEYIIMPNHMHGIIVIDKEIPNTKLGASK